MPGSDDRSARNELHDPTVGLSSDDRARFSRQLELPEWSEGTQADLRAANVFIAGAGGLGSAVALYLAAAGIGRVTLADPDTVELSNLNRQILYASGDIGAPKVTAAAARLTSLDPSTVVRPLSERIDERNARRLVAGHDIVIDCLDSLASRFVLNRAAHDMRIPMVYGAVARFTGHVSLLRPPETPCLACFVPDKEPPTPTPVLGCTAGLIGTLQATEAIKHLTGIGEPLAGRLLVVDTLALRFDVLDVEKDAACPVCSGQDAG